MVDPEIATVQGSAIVRSMQVGSTKLIVRDHRNYENWDSIDVEVAHVNHMHWLEEQIEAKAAYTEGMDYIEGETRTMSLMAFDKQGRKFTNCTAINPTFSLKGDGNIELVE